MQKQDAYIHDQSVKLSENFAYRGSDNITPSVASDQSSSVANYPILTSAKDEFYCICTVLHTNDVLQV